MKPKTSLAPCNGMSPNGLVCRVAVGDLKKECEDVISICMGSTSADIEGKNNAMLKKYPIIAINGCGNNCVDKILENKGIEISKSVNANEVLKNHNVKSNDAFRLDDEGEKCVKIIKEELKNSL
ncbi:MAG: zinc-binding protein [Methanobrevibacter sp.]|nr:zinc-binding protein [Methanobrevibacter sp.]